MRITRVLSSALIAATLSNCTLFKKSPDKQDPDKPKTEAPKLVGRVASIPPDRKFVLIQSYGPWKSDAGAILTTRGPENRAANLLVTGEKLGDFAAADLQSGTVEIGDGVYSRHVPKPVEPAPEPPADTQVADPQKHAEPENVQKNN